MAQHGAEHDWLALGREVLAVEAEGLACVRDALGPEFADAVRLLGACRGRVVVSGLGKSGLVGRKIAATLSSTGTPSFFLHPVEGAHGDLGMIRPEDVVLAISNSGETDELNAILPSLKSLGVAVVALTGDPASTLAGLADVVVGARVEREACPLNLAPTASTTAALAVGDALAVCLIHLKSFSESDFKSRHPGGALGQRLRLKVADLMHADRPVARVDTPLGEALDRLNAGGLGCLAVLEADGRLAGVLTDGDVRRLVVRGPVDPARPVAECMTRNPRSASLAASAAEVLDLMEERAITVVPVVDEAGRVAGMVHLHDLLGKGRLKFAG
jgi:arabinose-5-phosphate isomerase